MPTNIGSIITLRTGEECKGAANGWSTIIHFTSIHRKTLLVSISFGIQADNWQGASVSRSPKWPWCKMKLEFMKTHQRLITVFNNNKLGLPPKIFQLVDWLGGEPKTMVVFAGRRDAILHVYVLNSILNRLHF